MEEENKSRKSYTIGTVSYNLAAVFIVTGLIFKFMHYPGVVILIALGLASAVVWFVVDVLLKKKK